MLRRSNYDLVDEDGYDMRIPAVSEEAFQYGIIFKVKYVGSLDIPRPSSRTDIISAMRRIRCEYKLRSAKKKKIAMIISVDGIKIFLRKSKYSSKRLLSPFVRREQSASAIHTMHGSNGNNSTQLTRANSAAPLSAYSIDPISQKGIVSGSATADTIGNISFDNTSCEAKTENGIAESKSLNMLSGSTMLPEDEPILFHHPIHRVFFVSHYSPDERVFSYIARNSTSQQHQQSGTVNSPFTCYVFKTYKKSEAIRIVRTIGQSFEVCHNLSQKNQSKQRNSENISKPPPPKPLRQSITDDSRHSPPEDIMSKSLPEGHFSSRNVVMSTSTQSVSKSRPEPVDHSELGSNTTSMSINLPSKSVDKTGGKMSASVTSSLSIGSTISPCQQVAEAYDLQKMTSDNEMAVLNPHLMISNSNTRSNVVETRFALFQRMIELQRQENEASMAQAERLRQQLMAECDARQAAQQRNYQLLKQNCELVDKLTQLFDRLERVEKSLVATGNVSNVCPSQVESVKSNSLSDTEGLNFEISKMLDRQKQTPPKVVPRRIPPAPPPPPPSRRSDESDVEKIAASVILKRLEDEITQDKISPENLKTDTDKPKSNGKPSGRQHPLKHDFFSCSL